MRSFILILLLAFSAAQISAHDTGIVVDENTVTISVEENASTGYKWYISTWNSDILSPAESGVKNVQSNRVGAPYTREFVLKKHLKNRAVPTATEVIMLLIAPNDEVARTERFLIRL